MTQVFEETSPPGATTAAIVEHVCSLQLNYLVQQLSALAGWIVYESIGGCSGDRLQSVCCSGSGNAMPEPLALSALPWLDTAMPELISTELTSRTTPQQLITDGGGCPDMLPTPEASVGAISQLPMAEDSMVSIYWLNPRSRSEYLLLWTEDTPTACDRALIEQQGARLKAYLTHERSQTQRQASIQLLEQAFQRVEHQIRNPLALIGLYANTLHRQLPIAEHQTQTTLIKTTVEQLQTQLKGLISCSRGHQLHYERHDLQSILAESILSFQGLWVDQPININTPDNALYLILDRGQIRQVFDNLLHNALCFSPPQGCVIWQWQSFQQEVLITVSDQGPGIDEAKLTQIFDPYYSDRPDGTGLGLAIAKKIVLDHGGQIWVENLPERGCQFSVSLPRVPPNR